MARTHEVTEEAGRKAASLEDTLEQLGRVDRGLPVDSTTIAADVESAISAAGWEQFCHYDVVQAANGHGTACECYTYYRKDSPGRSMLILRKNNYIPGRLNRQSLHTADSQVDSIGIFYVPNAALLIFDLETLDINGEVYNANRDNCRGLEMFLPTPMNLYLRKGSSISAQESLRRALKTAGD